MSEDPTVEELQEISDEARALAEELGLSPLPVNYWLVDYDQMYKLISYEGFQRRYPHWRWGMKYEKTRKEGQYGAGKVFEIVNHDTPANAFLQKSNSLVDQKSVITHVEAHADFFANNQWFNNRTDAAAMLEQHAKRVEKILERPDVSREQVESWIDTLVCIEDNIDQHRRLDRPLQTDEEETIDIQQKVEALDLSDDVQKTVFDDTSQEDSEGSPLSYEEKDLFAFLLEHGKHYDQETAKAVEYSDWQKELIEIIRREAYYFAPQTLTGTMNEGWAALWESRMMSDEDFVTNGNLFEYADKQSKVLQDSAGFNPYSLGKQIWEYIESRANRKEVVQRLLRVKDITWRNFKNEVDFEYVQKFIEETVENSDDPIKRNYSLARPQNTGFLKQVTSDRLEEIARYMFDINRYETVDEALSEINYEAGWERLREVRESHNDVMFLDEYVTEEFIKNRRYFTYEYDIEEEEYKIASRDEEDVKQKLLLEFTNFGKPTIYAKEHNYNNSGELLLVHEYNGVMMDVSKAKRLLERLFKLWGRPVNLKTIVKLKSGEQTGALYRYDGESIEETELDWEEVEDIASDDLSYDTRPENW